MPSCLRVCTLQLERISKCAILKVIKDMTYQNFPDDLDARNVYQGSLNKASDSKRIDSSKYLILIQATCTLLA
jgi:hypothetical protein